MASDTGSSWLLIVQAATAALLTFALSLPANAQFWGNSWGWQQPRHECRHRRFPPRRRPDASRRNARPGLAATDDREASAERGERFCRRQPNAIGGTRDQDLLVVHGTQSKGSGRAIKDLALDQVRANGASQQRIERCALTKSPPRRGLARRIGPGRNAPLPSWVARRRAISTMRQSGSNPALD